MNAYHGILRVEGETVSLEVGGLVVKVDGNAGPFIPLKDRFVTVMGQQEGGIIRHAVPAPEAETTEDVSDNMQLERVLFILKAHQKELSSQPGVIGVRPGFNEKDEAVIIVVTDPETPLKSTPAKIDGVTVEYRKATALEQTEKTLSLSVWEGLIPEARPNINYVPPDPTVVSLVERNVSNITCHVGPDSGWTTLKPFLEGTMSSLTVAMYEFYAPHIVDTVTSLGRQSDARLNMILQVDRNDKDAEQILSDSWGDRLDFAKASVSGPNRIFNNSYHTKVAVRDSSAFWLSSGNWSPGSQPLIKAGTENFPYKNGNREWHVIIEDEAMAKMYEKFIQYDMQKACEAGEPEAAPLLPDLLVPETLFEAEAAVIQPHPFEPKTFATNGQQVRVKPLMSPDNYATEVLKLIRSAKQSLYLQFSYIRQPSTETFDEIISAITAKMKDGLDVRVLVGKNQNPEHSDLLIGKRQWKRSMFRFQTSKLHNKGILIDGKVAVVGSNNCSSDGTQYNRDTSLVFYSRPIAQYYTEVFLFDWENLSRPINSVQESFPVLAPESGPTPVGMIRIPWQSWFND